MHTRRLATLILACLIGVSAVSGQQVSEKRDVAVFGLSQADWRIPPNALALVDEEVKDVFINLGRFNILGMDYRLEADGIDAFIEKIKEVKERNAEIPETVRLGQEAFTEADFNRLVGSFIVVMPTVSYYATERTDSGDHSAELDVTFTFFNVEKAETIAYFGLETSGTGDTPTEAVKDASEDIASKLQFELRSIPEFQLKTGIIEVQRGNVILEFGANMGVRRGDEYAITEAQVLQSGYTVKDEIGLLIVKDVESEISYAKVIYSSRRPQIGDQLQEIPRLGFDTGAYGHLIVGPRDTGIFGTVGIRQSTSRGFYSFRPFVGLEVPFAFIGSLGTSGFTLNLYGGGELNWYLWRFQFVPAAAVGIAGTVPKGEDESFSVSHVGGFVQLTTSLLVSRDFRIAVDAGYAGWFAPGEEALPYSGVMFGAGATYKY